MCAVTAPVSVTLPVEAAAAGRARAFLSGASCKAHTAGVLDEAQLLVSELVGNAVRHGAPPITVQVQCDGEAGMQVRVSDGDPTGPRVRRAGRDAESGRGMALVDVISDDWGVEPAQEGKAVWFRLGPQEG